MQNLLFLLNLHLYIPEFYMLEYSEVLLPQMLLNLLLSGPSNLMPDLRSEAQTVQNYLRFLHELVDHLCTAQFQELPVLQLQCILQAVCNVQLHHHKVLQYLC